MQAEIGIKYVHEGQDRAYAVFDTYKSGSRKVLYLSGVIVDPSLQARGVGEQLIRRGQELTGADMLLFRTQSARMLALGEKVTRSLYPQTPDRADMPVEVLAVGEDTAAQMGGEFPFQPGVYDGESLYGEPQGHSKQAFMDTLCNAAMGDAVLFLGEFAEAKQ